MSALSGSPSETQAAAASEPKPQLSAAQQIERLVAALALIGLALTGLPQHYSTEGWARVIFVLGGGIESLRILHRFFAVLFMGEAIYHLLAVGYRWFVLNIRPVMLPGLGDVRDLILGVLGNLGLRRMSGAPDYRFALKFEYLILILAVIILGITGLILWNPIAATNVLSGEAIPVARTVHSEHALLTIGLIVLLRLGILLLWHPRRAQVYADAAARRGALPEEAIRSRRGRYLPVALIIGTILAVGLLLVITSEQTAINTVPRQQAVIFAPQVVPSEGDPHIGEVLWQTTRCAFCHGIDANGGTHSEPSLRNRTDLTFEAFYQQVRVGEGEMPAFTAEELPDGYLVHLWAWLSQPAE